MMTKVSRHTFSCRGKRCNLTNHNLSLSIIVGIDSIYTCMSVKLYCCMSYIYGHVCIYACTVRDCALHIENLIIIIRMTQLLCWSLKRKC